MNDYTNAETNIFDGDNSLLQHICDIQDVTPVGRPLAADDRKIDFSIPLSDFLPMMFQEDEINILDSLQLILNFKDMNQLFFISGTGTDNANVALN